MQAAIAAVPGVKAVQGLGDGTFTLEADLDMEVRPELARCIVQRGWDLLELKTQEFTLEDVFINLVTEEGSTMGAASSAPGISDAGAANGALLNK